MGISSPALVVGAHSPTFWSQAEAVRLEIRDALIADAGFTFEDAPRALQLLADSTAMAAILQHSTWGRLVEACGPLTSNDRQRRVLSTWLQSSDRLERGLRVLGLKRIPRDVGDSWNKDDE